MERAREKTLKACSKLITTDDFQILISFVAHLAFCAAQSLSNAARNLGEFWVFEENHGASFGRIVPGRNVPIPQALRDLRQELDIVCRDLNSAATAEERNFERLAELADELCEKVDLELGRVRSELLNDSIPSFDAALKNVQGTLVRFAFLSCSCAGRHPRLTEVQNRITQKYKPDVPTLNPERILREVRNAVPSTIDTLSQLFVPACCGFVNNPRSVVEEDMDSFVDKSLGPEVGARALIKPCILYRRAIEQLWMLFPVMAHAADNKVVAVEPSVELETWATFKKLIDSLAQFSYLPLGKALAAAGESSPLEAAVFFANDLCIQFPQQDGTAMEALKRLLEILQRAVTETFAGTIFSEQAAFLRKMDKIRKSASLNSGVNVQITGEQRVNWKVFNLSLFFNPDKLYSDVRSMWKPSPPSEAVMHDWFGKFDVLLSGLVVGTENCADLLVEFFRCAPHRLTSRDALQIFRERLQDVDAVLKISLSELVDDSGAFVVPKALCDVYEAEAQLLALLQESVWQDLESVVHKVQSQDSLWSLVDRCRGFAKMTNSIHGTWDASSKSFIDVRYNKNLRWFEAKQSSATARYAELQNQAEKARENWRLQKDRFENELRQFGANRHKFRSLLTDLIIRDGVTQASQRLVASLQEFDSDYKRFVNKLPRPGELVFIPSHVVSSVKMTFPSAKSQAARLEYSIVVKDAAGETVTSKTLRPTWTQVWHFWRLPPGFYPEPTSEIMTLDGMDLARASTLEFGGQFQRPSRMMTTPERIPLTLFTTPVPMTGGRSTIELSNVDDQKFPFEVEVTTTARWVPAAQKLQDETSSSNAQLPSETARMWQQYRSSVPQTEDPPPLRVLDPAGPARITDDSASKHERDLQNFSAMPHNKCLSGVKDSSEKILVRVCDFMNEAEKRVKVPRDRAGLSTLVFGAPALPRGVAGMSGPDLISNINKEVEVVMRLLGTIVDLPVVQPTRKDGQFGTMWTPEMKDACFTCLKEAQQQLLPPSVVGRLAASLSRLAVLTTILNGLHSDSITDFEEGSRSQMDRDIGWMLEHTSAPWKQALINFRDDQMASFALLVPRLRVMGDGKSFFKQLMHDLLSESIPRVLMPPSKDSWMRVFDQKLHHATTVTFSQGPTTTFLVEPAHVSIGFGVVLFGTASPHHELCLMNGTPDALDLELSFVVKDADGETVPDTTNAFFFEGGRTKREVRVPRMSSVTVEVALRVEDGVHQSSLVIHASHGPKPQQSLDPVFEIPVDADVQRVGASLQGGSEVDGVLQVDLGTVMCGSRRSHEVSLQNLCGSSYLVQAQVQNTTSRSKLSVKFLHSAGSSAQSVAHLHARENVQMAIELVGCGDGEDFEVYVLVAFLSEQNLKWIHVTAKIVDHEFQVLCDPSGQMLGRNSPLEFGPVEIGSCAQQCLEIRNTGKVEVVFKASIESSKLFHIFPEGGTVRPDEALRLLVTVKSPVVSKTLTGSLVMFFNKERWSLAMRAEFGTRDLKIFSGPLKVNLKELVVGQGKGPVCLNEILDGIPKKEVTVKFRNTGSLPVEVWLQKNTYFRACDGDGARKQAILPGATLEFETKLISLPPTLGASTKGELVFRTNSRDPSRVTLKHEYNIQIRKAVLEVTPWGCWDLGEVLVGSNSFAEKSIKVHNKGTDAAMEVSITVSAVKGAVLHLKSSKGDEVGLSAMPVGNGRDSNGMLMLEAHLDVEPDFEGGLMFEVCITAMKDLVWAPGSATELTSQMYSLLVVARVAGSESKAPQLSLGRDQFELLRTDCIRQVWTADAYLDETAAGVPAALVVCACSSTSAVSSVLPSLVDPLVPSAFGKAQDLFPEVADCVRAFSPLENMDRDAGRVLTVGQLSGHLKSFADADHFQKILGSLARQVEQVRVLNMNSSSAGVLVRKCCKILSRRGGWGSSAAAGLLALFDDEGKITGVENLLWSLAFANQRRSTAERLPALLVAVGKLQTQGSLVNILEAVSPDFLSDAGALKNAQRFVGQDSRSALGVCRDVVLQGVPESQRLQGFVDMISDLAYRQPVDIQRVVAAPVSMAAILLSQSPQHLAFLQKLEQSLKQLLSPKTPLDRMSQQRDAVEAVVLMLSGGELSDLDPVRDVLKEVFKTDQTASVFRGMDDAGRDAALEVLLQKHGAKVDETGEVDEIARAKIVRARILEALSSFVKMRPLRNFGFREFFDNCCKLCMSVVQPVQRSSFVAVTALQGILKHCHSVSNVTADVTRLVFFESMTLVSQLTGQSLDFLSAKVSTFFESNTAASAVALVQGVGSLAGGISEDRKSKMMDIRRRSLLLQQALQQCPGKLSQQLLDEVAPVVAVSVLEELRSKIAARCVSSAADAAALFEDALECVKKHAEPDGTGEAAVLRAVQAVSRRYCDGLIAALHAMCKETEVKKLSAFLKSFGERTAVAGIDDGEKVKSAWLAMHENALLPRSLKKSVGCGASLLSHQGKELRSGEVKNALLAWRELSGDEQSVSWLVQLLLGAQMQLEGSVAGNSSMEAAAAVVVITSVFTMVKHAAAPQIPVDHWDDGAAKFVDMLSPILPAPPAITDFGLPGLIATDKEEPVLTKASPIPLMGRDHPMPDTPVVDLLAPEDPVLPEGSLEGQASTVSLDPAEMGAEEIEGILKRAQVALSFSEHANSSVVLIGLLDAVVLAVPAARKWLQACTHMSAIAQSETPPDKASQVAQKLFRQGFQVVRLMKAILVLGRPLSQGQRLFPAVETLVRSVADSLLLLAVELREPEPPKYLKELGLLTDGSAFEAFTMPPVRKAAPGQKQVHT